MPNFGEVFLKINFNWEICVSVRLSFYFCKNLCEALCDLCETLCN